MSREILCHITSEDKVLGPISREVAHENPSLIHREVAVLLKDDVGRLLLSQKRNRGL